jgi:hypothetical protein
VQVHNTRAENEQLIQSSQEQATQIDGLQGVLVEQQQAHDTTMMEMKDQLKDRVDAIQAAKVQLEQVGISRCVVDPRSCVAIVTSFSQVFFFFLLYVYLPMLSLSVQVQQEHLETMKSVVAEKTSLEEQLAELVGAEDAAKDAQLEHISERLEQTSASLAQSQSQCIALTEVGGVRCVLSLCVRFISLSLISPHCRFSHPLIL